MTTHSRSQRVPARRGVAVQLTAGQTVRLVNTSGKQVVDTWGFNPSDMLEFLSMEHSRVAMQKLIRRSATSSSATGAGPCCASWPIRLRDTTTC
jgi:uncharacterized protein YcgI (DUF1989 family)